MKIGELFVTLGIEADVEKAKEFFNTLLQGKEILFGVAAMAVGTSIGIGSMLNKALEASIALSNFTAETGLSAQTLQGWQHVSEAVGGTAKDATNSIQNLTRSLVDMKITGHGAGETWYSRLGINPMAVKDTWQMLDILSAKIRSGRYSPTVMAEALQGFGLTGPWMRILQDPDFAKHWNKEAVIPKEWIDRAIKFNASMKELGQTITYLFADAFQQLEPTMTGLLGKVESWIAKNKTAIKAGIVTYTNEIIEFAVETGKIAAQIDKVVSSTLGWKTALEGIAMIIIAFNPFLRLVTSIYMILDLISRMQGPGTWQEKLNKAMHGEMGVLTAPLGWGTKSGEWLGENTPLGSIISGIAKTMMPDLYYGLDSSGRPKTGMDSFDLMRDMPTPIINPGTGKTINFTPTIHIQSNATDNKEVAELVNQHMSRLINSASLQVA